MCRVCHAHALSLSFPREGYVFKRREVQVTAQEEREAGPPSGGRVVYSTVLVLVCTQREQTSWQTFRIPRKRDLEIFACCPSPTKGRRDAMNCLPWCNQWTCEKNECTGCEVCTSGAAKGQDGARASCLGWCSKWTCKKHECSSCEVCGGEGASDAQRDAVTSGCQTWCSEYTCNQPSECGACAECAPNPPPPPLRPNAFGRNPFASPGGWYVNPTLRDNFERSIASASAQEAATLRKMMTVPSAFWIDNKAKIFGRDRLYTLEGILQDAASKLTPPLCVFIFYDLPNRDCNAKASNGEISDATAGSSAALREYKQEYVEKFVQVLEQYSSVPVALAIEPDSLGNVISNAGSNGCSLQVVENYKEGVAYAIRTLAARVPRVAIYVDAAHGGWMGFEHNAQAFVDLMNSMHILHLIRGFSVNVANYQTLGLSSVCPKEAFAKAGQMVHGATRGVAQYCHDLQNAAATTPLSQAQKACCETDPCHLMNIGSGGSTELSYVQTLQQHFIQTTGWAPYFIIDTGRNGATVDERSTCSSWCNARGAGAGHVATMNTKLPEVVDAFFWLKTPGESDGCTRVLPSGEQCARFDASCESMDSIGGPTGAGEPHAPEAGMWFDYQVKMLARNANLRLDSPGALDSMWNVKGSIALDIEADMKTAAASAKKAALSSPPPPLPRATSTAAQPAESTTNTQQGNKYSYDSEQPLSNVIGGQAAAWAAEAVDYRAEHAVEVVSRVNDADWDLDPLVFEPPPPPADFISMKDKADAGGSSSVGTRIALIVGTWVILGLLVIFVRRWLVPKDATDAKKRSRRRSRERSRVPSAECDGLVQDEVDDDEESPTQTPRGRKARAPRGGPPGRARR